MADTQAWPLEVMRKVYPDGSTVLVELECDEVAVLHIVETGTPEADMLQLGGASFKLSGDAKVEQWVYLSDPQAMLRLRDGLSELLSTDAADVRKEASGR